MTSTFNTLRVKTRRISANFARHSGDMTTKPDTWVREAIHARLWMNVMVQDRVRRDGRLQSEPGWLPDRDVYRGERYQSPGCPDPDFEYMDDFAPAQDIEKWLRDKGVIYVPEEPDDASIYLATIKGTAPTLRASLHAIDIDQDWVPDIALQHMLWDGAHFYPRYGENDEHRLDRLPTGWGTHVRPAHFAPLIDSLAAAGFCEVHDDNTFTWNEVMARHGKAALPLIWGDGPNRWEQRKWELNYIWREMPLGLKQKYLIDKGPLSIASLNRDLSAFYDRKARRWRDKPITDPDLLFRTYDIASEFDRLDREDGLAGRTTNPALA
ncbi:MAG: hypothetical protein ABJF50_14265 [Paracoccaceae bacterium]